MNKKGFNLIPFITFFLLIPTVALSGDLQAHFSYCAFNSPLEGPYLETYLMVNGNSIQYVETEEGWQGAVEVKMIFHEKDSVKAETSFMATSPYYSSMEEAKTNYISQYRIAVPNGRYRFEIRVKDSHGDQKELTSIQKLLIDFPKGQMSMSDIEFYDSMNKTETPTMYTKSGFEVIPYPSDFYPETIDKLGFYMEVYNSEKRLGAGEKYLLSYFIENSENGEVISNFKGFSRTDALEVNVLARAFDISDLPSGNYNLVVEARDRNNEILYSRRAFFQRSNPKIGLELASAGELTGKFVDHYVNRDSLAEHIRSLEPISDPLEVQFAQNQVLAGDLNMMRQYFYSFWAKKDPEYPEQAWMKYYRQVIKVNANYGTKLKPGYLSDRGYRYLKYGPPDALYESFDEPLAYPYEIWQYNKIANQVNRKFIFYNPNLAGNDFILLHSDANGERYNPNWHAMLHERNSKGRSVEDAESPEHYGGRAKEIFEMPR